MGPYRASNPLLLTVLAAKPEDYTTAPQHLQHQLLSALSQCLGNVTQRPTFGVADMFESFEYRITRGLELNLIFPLRSYSLAPKITTSPSPNFTFNIPNFYCARIQVLRTIKHLVMTFLTWFSNSMDKLPKYGIFSRKLNTSVGHFGSLLKDIRFLSKTSEEITCWYQFFAEGTI